MDFQFQEFEESIYESIRNLPVKFRRYVIDAVHVKVGDKVDWSVEPTFVDVEYEKDAVISLTFPTYTEGGIVTSLPEVGDVFESNSNKILFSVDTQEEIVEKQKIEKRRQREIAAAKKERIRLEKIKKKKEEEEKKAAILRKQEQEVERQKALGLEREKRTHLEKIKALEIQKARVEKRKAIELQKANQSHEMEKKRLEVENEKAKTTQKLLDSLDDIGKLPLSMFLTAFLEKLKKVEGQEFQGENHSDLLRVFAALKKSFERNNLISPERLKTITPDVFRINQIETIMDLYGEKIRKVQEDESLDLDEKQLKVDYWVQLRERDIQELQGMN